MNALYWGTVTGSLWKVNLCGSKCYLPLAWFTASEPILAEEWMDNSAFRLHFLKRTFLLTRLFVFILFEWQRDRNRDLCSSHSPKACSRRGWSRSKAEARNSILVSHEGSRDLSIWAITSYLPGHTLAESWIGNGEVGIWSEYSKMACRRLKQKLNCCAKRSTPLLGIWQELGNTELEISFLAVLGVLDVLLADSREKIQSV